MKSEESCEGPPDRASLPPADSAGARSGVEWATMLSGQLLAALLLAATLGGLWRNAELVFAIMLTGSACSLFNAIRGDRKIAALQKQLESERRFRARSDPPPSGMAPGSIRQTCWHCYQPTKIWVDTAQVRPGAMRDVTCARCGGGAR